MIYINYYNPIVDDNGNVHSIDMVYVEYFSRLSPSSVVDEVRKIFAKYPFLKYDEYLDRLPQHKYDFYLNSISIGGVYVQSGKYKNYDKITKTFDMLPMVKLRVNPNKHMNEPWFLDLLSLLGDEMSSGVLLKYDYAIDIPTEPKNVEVLETRKEPGLYKGTRYYGQQGRHGYLKIYDKQKDMARHGIDLPVTTRVEHTQNALKERSLENVYVLTSSVLKTDYSALNDTDKVIVDMFLKLKGLGCCYDLRQLGRKKYEKLKEYVSGTYALLEYNNILDDLLGNIKRVFHVTDSISDSDMFLQDEDGFLDVDTDDVPFDL